MEETPGRASLEKLGCRTPPQLHAGGVGRQQQQQLLEFFFNSVMLTCNMMRFLSLLLLGLCPCRGTLCGETVMRVLLFVLHVCMLRECEGDGNAGGG